MQNRINKLACVFVNDVQEENFLLHRWKQISKSIKNNIWFNIFSGVDGKFKRMSGQDDRIRIWFDKNKDASIANEIKKFKDLLHSGAITKEEYDTKKKELLDL